MGSAATAEAAPIQVSAVNWDLMMHITRFEYKLSGDCLDVSKDAFGWGDFSAHSPFKYTHVYEGVGVAVGGSFDPATRRGVLTGSGSAIRIDNFNAHAGAIRIGSLGLKASGASAIVTGRIQRARTIFARSSSPKPLLRLTRLTFETGPFQRQGKDLPDTFVMVLQGRATVLPTLARELTRIRCKGPHIVTSHPIRAGSLFGAVRVQLRPDAATGIGGTFELGDLRASGYDASTDQDVSATVMPIAPARLAGKAIHWDLPADQRTPLQCVASYNCLPAIGSQFTLGGGFVLSAGNRSTTVANVSVATQDFNGSPGPVITGTLDGAPITLIRGPDTTSEFDERLAAALGISDVRTAISGVFVHFAKTVPP